MGPGPVANLSLHHFPMAPVCLEDAQYTCVTKGIWSFGEKLWVGETPWKGKAVAALCQEQAVLRGRAEPGAAVWIWGLGTMLVAPPAVTGKN